MITNAEEAAPKLIEAVASGLYLGLLGGCLAVAYTLIGLGEISGDEVASLCGGGLFCLFFVLIAQPLPRWK